MSFILCIVVVICVSIIPTQSTRLCNEGKGYWYDIQDAKCRPCKECPAKAFKLESCSDFMDTWCIDFSELGKSMKTSQESVAEEDVPHKWHEMEGEDNSKHEDAGPSTIFRSKFEKVSVTLLCVCFLILCVCICAWIMLWRYKGNAPLRGADIDHNSFPRRDRLFSRDRLNTTEFMNNLATLDRRLAMDEILEKRKAIFEPQLLAENLYTDEVFIDYSGLPKNLSNEAQDQEPEHRRWLLRVQDNL